MRAVKRSGARLLRWWDFARDLDQATTISDGVALLQKTIESIGFISFDYGRGTIRHMPVRSMMDISLDLHLSTIDWSVRYVEKGYQAVDRASFTSLTREMPWLYREVLDRAPINSLQAEMEDDVRQFVSSGLAIPLHSIGSTYGLMHLGSLLPKDEFDRLDLEMRPTATLIAGYFHAFVDRMQRQPTIDVAPLILLSTREIECLIWASQGKTNWEISVILGCAERTVRSHFSAALRKLDVRSRAQAVTKALALGLISP